MGLAAASALLGALSHGMDSLVAVAFGAAIVSLAALAWVSWHPRRRAGMGWRIGASLALALPGSGLALAALLER